MKITQEPFQGILLSLRLSDLLKRSEALWEETKLLLPTKAKERVPTNVELPLMWGKGFQRNNTFGSSFGYSTKKLLEISSSLRNADASTFSSDGA